MANYTINQVTHLYVAKTLKTGTSLLATDEAGSILPKGNTAQTELYFQYMSPAGIVRSDLIPVPGIMYAKATSSEKLAKPLCIKKVVLNADAPVSGQEYILRVCFREFIGLGEADQHVEYGYVQATSGMTASDLYKKVAISLAKACTKETGKYVTVYVTDGSSNTEVTEDTKDTDLTGTYTAILVEEAAQPWILGTMAEEVIPFDVQTAEVWVNGEEVLWGTVTNETPVNTVPNGHNIADFEYFCMGARGDDYRNVGFPRVVRTTYLVDPAKEYDTLNIHYAFTDSNEGVQKSEKDIVIVCEDDGSHTDMNALIAAVNAKLPTDKQITTLS